MNNDYNEYKQWMDGHNQRMKAYWAQMDAIAERRKKLHEELMFGFLVMMASWGCAALILICLTIFTVFYQ